MRLRTIDLSSTLNSLLQKQHFSNRRFKESQRMLTHFLPFYESRQSFDNIFALAQVSDLQPLYILLR